MTATLPPRLSAETVYQGAVRAGVCVRPILRRLTDTTTGETSVIPIACGATRATVCPTCADANRRLRIHQCREGWHLTTEPDDDEDQADDEADGELLDDQDDSDDGDQERRGRRRRSTRRRADVPDLPRLPVASTTLGRSFTDTTTGRTFRPSMFLTLTLGSYGRVRDDGAPVDPASYDYRRAGLDALHLSKLFDRFIQNLRRAVGYQVQYFAVLEPQRRLAPHLHVAIRGTMPRKLLKQVIAATYASVWWPPHHEPVYGPGRRPVWDHATGQYLDPDTKQPLPTWADALDALDDNPAASPAHVVRFGAQSDMQGLLAGTDSCDRRVGYLTKYLTKAVGDPLNGDDPADETPARRAHAARLVDELRLLPCSPRCANWLAYGIQPKEARAGLVPGQCGEKHHDRDHLGCGGRRVLVSRKWTGKTLDDHRADRRSAVLDVLQAAGADLPEAADHHSATVLRPDGRPRYQWEPLDPDRTSSYLAVIARMIAERTRWRTQYEAARDSTRPPFGNSADGEARVDKGHRS